MTTSSPDQDVPSIKPLQRITLEVDEQQLNRVLSDGLNRDASKVKASDVLALVQVIALIVGGGYAVIQTLKQSALTAEQLRLTVQAQERQNRQLDLSLKHRQEQRHGFESRAKISAVGTEGGLKVYYVEYAYNFTNISDEPFKVQFMVLDAYLGTPKPPSQAGPIVIQLNDPLTSEGGIAWNSLLLRQVSQYFDVSDWAKGRVRHYLSQGPKLPLRGDGARLGTAQSARFVRFGAELQRG